VNRFGRGFGQDPIHGQQQQDKTPPKLNISSGHMAVSSSDDHPFIVKILNEIKIRNMVIGCCDVGFISRGS
jgi:hypothetical protein